MLLVLSHVWFAESVSVADPDAYGMRVDVSEPDSEPEGRSAATRDRNVGAAADPVVGPANTLFAVCVASVPVSVPVAVTGEPETEKILGRLNATLVTGAPDDAEVMRPCWSTVMVEKL